MKVMEVMVSDQLSATTWQAGIMASSHSIVPPLLSSSDDKVGGQVTQPALGCISCLVLVRSFS